MHETRDDLDALQGLLDRSYASAGPHLRRIITPERRLMATEVCERLTGMRLLAVTVHGRAVPVETETGQFRDVLLETYVPRYGPEWEHGFLDSGPVYARIEPDRMFTFH